MQLFLGIDVSKAKLDAALLLATGKFKSKVFANDSVGFAALLQWLTGQVPGVAQAPYAREAQLAIQPGAAD